METQLKNVVHSLLHTRQTQLHGLDLGFDICEHGDQVRVRCGPRIVRLVLRSDTLRGDEKSFTTFLEVDYVFRDVMEATKRLSVLIDFEDFLEKSVFNTSN